MASHNELGRNGEILGKTFLEKSGFTILHLNWKHSFYEIDIIAVKENVLHFIEVKTRRSHRFGLPEESVNHKKLEKMMKASDAFMCQSPDWKKVQYDILSISILNNNIPDFFFIEDVYI